jgi:anti-sigma B factor antagonist
MELTTREQGRVTVLTVTGDLVSGEPEATFNKTIAGLIEERRVQILVDLEKLKFLDSSGLGALVRALNSAQKAGGQTKLVHVGPHVAKLLQMTRLDSVFEIHGDLERAVSSF